MPKPDTSELIDRLLQNWNDGFSALNKRKAEGTPVEAEDVREHVLAAGRQIFENHLDIDTVSDSGHKVREFKDIFDRVRKTTVPVGDFAAGVNARGLHVNPIQLAAIQARHNPEEVRALIESIRNNSSFDPLSHTMAGSGSGDQTTANALAGGTLTFDDVESRAREVSVNLLNNEHENNATLTSTNSDELNELPVVIHHNERSSEKKIDKPENGGADEADSLANMPKPTMVFPKADQERRVKKLDHFDSSRVPVDPETGAFRIPTADELAAAMSSSGQSTQNPDDEEDISPNVASFGKDDSPDEDKPTERLKLFPNSSVNIRRDNKNDGTSITLGGLRIHDSSRDDEDDNLTSAPAHILSENTDQLDGLSSEQKNKFASWVQSDKAKGLVPRPPAATVNLHRLQNGASGSFNLREVPSGFGGAHTDGDSLVVTPKKLK